MTARDKIDKAKNFLSAYFHEDWGEEAQDPARVVSNYLDEGWRAAELLDIAEQIERYVARFADDKALDKSLFEDMGCYYSPSADGKTARAWLLELISSLRGEAERILRGRSGGQTLNSE